MERDFPQWGRLKKYRERVAIRHYGATLGVTLSATFLPTLHPAEALCLWEFHGIWVQRVARSLNLYSLGTTAINNTVIMK